MERVLSPMPTQQPPFQLLLFVDGRPQATLQIQSIQAALQSLDKGQKFQLQVLNVSEEPRLVEYFRLVATPALVKINPGPRQVLAGSDLVEQLNHWWPRWEMLLQEYTATQNTPSPQSAAIPLASGPVALALKGDDSSEGASRSGAWETTGWEWAESASRKSASRESASRESASRESANRESANRESASRESASRESASRESASRESASRELADVEAGPRSEGALRLGAKPTDGIGTVGPKVVASHAIASELLRLSDEIFVLKQDKIALEEQLQFKDRIIAMLAHDLRNPLTAASLAVDTLDVGLGDVGLGDAGLRDAGPGNGGLGGSAGLEERPSWTTEGDRLWTTEGDRPSLSKTMIRRLVSQLRMQIKSIDRMVTDILQAARGSTDALMIQPRRVDLTHLCSEVLYHLSDRMAAKSLVLHLDMPSDLPPIYADPDRVRQVLLNLLDNAIKYTPDHGSIGVSALHRTSQKIQISISDTGPGIPEFARETIFQDSFRLPRDRESDGYGIGLSVCQRIVRAHYGQIWVDAAQGCGSCFHFTLPVYNQYL